MALRRAKRGERRRIRFEQRLLDEDVLAVHQGRDDLAGVGVVVAGDRDDVDGRVGQDRVGVGDDLEVGMTLRDLVPFARAQIAQNRHLTTRMGLVSRNVSLTDT
jgi:hypothetical protein